MRFRLLIDAWLWIGEPSARGGGSGTGWRPHPIAVTGPVAAAIEGAIGGSRAVRPMRLMSDSVLHFSDNRFRALQETAWAETSHRWRSSPPRWKRLAAAHAAKARGGRGLSGRDDPHESARTYPFSVLLVLLPKRPAQDTELLAVLDHGAARDGHAPLLEGLGDLPVGERFRLVLAGHDSGSAPSEDDALRGVDADFRRGHGLRLG